MALYAFNLALWLTNFGRISMSSSWICTSATTTWSVNMSTSSRITQNSKEVFLEYSSLLSMAICMSWSSSVCCLMLLCTLVSSFSNYTTYLFCFTKNSSLTFVISCLFLSMLLFNSAMLLVSWKLFSQNYSNYILNLSEKFLNTCQAQLRCFQQGRQFTLIQQSNLTQQLYQNLANLTSLYNKRLQDILIFMFKVKHKLLRSLIIFWTYSAKHHLITIWEILISISHDSTVSGLDHDFGPKLSPRDRETQTLMALMTNIRKRDVASLVKNDFCNGNCPTCTC